jgi:hypothetical protein
MKLSASLLLLTSALATSQARSSQLRELSGSSTPTYSPTISDVSFNGTDDNAEDVPEAMAPEPNPEEDMMNAPETTTPSMFQEGEAPEAEVMGGPGHDMEGPAGLAERNETMFDSDETMAAPEQLKPEHDKPERNDTMMVGKTNETFADMGPGSHGPPRGFQELVDDKCASYECPMTSNSTCPTPPDAFDRNATEEMMAPPEPLDGMNMTDGESFGPPLDENKTEDKGLAPQDGPGKHGGPERWLKPKHHGPEALLECACCEGVTVDELDSTGVDVSGLAFLVGYDPSAATTYDNGSNLNSLVFSSAVAAVATTILAMFV